MPALPEDGELWLPAAVRGWESASLENPEVRDLGTKDMDLSSTAKDFKKTRQPGFDTEMNWNRLQFGGLLGNKTGWWEVTSQRWGCNLGEQYLPSIHMNSIPRATKQKVQSLTPNDSGGKKAAPLSRASSLSVLGKCSSTELHPQAWAPVISAVWSRETSIAEWKQRLTVVEKYHGGQVEGSTLSRTLEK